MVTGDQSFSILLSMLLGPLVFVCFSCVRAFYTFSREMLRIVNILGAAEIL